MQTKRHYEEHLAEYYSWIFGGQEANIARNRDFFTANRVTPSGSGTALDLGAGSGFQAIPLGRMGFKVTAIDFSSTLLQELEQNIDSEQIEILESDILKFSAYSGKKPELITCMGDTLTHLPDIESVESLIENCAQELVSGGKLILTFRDLSFELKGEERFIPVRSESYRVFTCFLEYHDEEVVVYDIVNELKNGSWQQRVSSYKKLRISEEQIKAELVENGLLVELQKKEQGMVTFIARKK